MKINNYKPGKSSFLSVEKDLEILINTFLSNDKLMNLIHYDSKDALMRPQLTMEQKIDMIGKNIKIIPKIDVDTDFLQYIIVNFDNFTPSKNTEFRDNIVEIDICCHFSQWMLGDFRLRPYRIAGEIDSMINNKHFSGIGTLQFINANIILLEHEYAGLCVQYAAIHGEDDKNDTHPRENPAHVQDFKDIIEDY